MNEKKKGKKMKIKNWLHKRKQIKSKPNYNIEASYYITGGGKGADIWGKDWVVPVAEKLEWSLFNDSTTHKQYLRTKLTDKIFFFIPFSYDEYIYEVPEDTYGMNTITNKDVVDAIAFCEKWNWHGDQVYCDDNYDNVNVHIVNNYSFKLGNGDYTFIRTRDEFINI